MADLAIRASYRRALARAGQPVTFRRVVGQAPSAVTSDYGPVTAIVRAYQPTQPIGAGAHNAEITEGLREFIVISDDLAKAGFPLPLLKNDKIITGAEALNITEVDPGTRYVAGAIEGRAVGV